MPLLIISGRGMPDTSLLIISRQAMLGHAKAGRPCVAALWLIVGNCWIVGLLAVRAGKEAVVDRIRRWVHAIEKGK